MREFSKYRVIMVGILLMFVFVIAAIYTNTKDIADKKMRQTEALSSQHVPQVNDSSSQESVIIVQEPEPKPAAVEEEFNNKILELKDRIDSLEKKVYNDNSSDNNGVRCTVKGIIDDGHFIPMAEDAVRESKENNKEVVITCVFN